MVIKYLDGGRITGLSTDAKPTNIPTGSSFIETDTGSKYVHNGTAWIQEQFDSINSAFGKSGGVTQRQHFVEWFTGKSLNTDRWGKGGDGNETIEMYDGIDGGVLIEPDNSGIYKPALISTGFSGSRTSSSDATVRPFSPYGCSCIWVERWISGASTTEANTWDGGFCERPSGDAASENSCFWVGRGNWTTYKTRGIASDSSQTDVDSGFTITNNSVCFKLEMTVTQINGTINGVLKTTQSTGNFPSAKMAVVFGIQGRNASGYTANQRLVRYIEAYNT